MKENFEEKSMGSGFYAVRFLL